MSLSRDQQVTFRRQVSLAWARVAKARGLEPKDAAAKDVWYRAVMERATGVTSTLELSARAHFAEACAAFEEIHGQSIYWTLRALGGSDAEQKRRALYAIRELAVELAAPEDYLAGVARAACKLDRKPELDRLTGEQLVAVLRILRAQKATIAARMNDKAHGQP